MWPFPALVFWAVILPPKQWFKRRGNDDDGQSRWGAFRASTACLGPQQGVLTGWMTDSGNLDGVLSGPHMAISGCRWGVEGVGSGFGPNSPGCFEAFALYCDCPAQKTLARFIIANKTEFRYPCP